ncbi:hypothetical protein PPGU19_082370 (plasmid) [Paraburkholderia sp. PGU19]|nr:hypothetical protein PPGU19_082370 [Paraburkholderia sp. PGU19]
MNALSTTSPPTSWQSKVPEIALSFWITKPTGRTIGLASGPSLRLSADILVNGGRKRAGVHNAPSQNVDFRPVNDRSLTKVDA